MSFSDIINYLVTQDNIYIMLRMLLNVIATVMLCGIIKSIFKSLKTRADIRRIVLQISNIVIGGALGFCLYSFETVINIIVGACCGFMSAVVYKILLKKIYEKYGINADPEASTFPPSKEDL